MNNTYRYTDWENLDNYIWNKHNNEIINEVIVLITPSNNEVEVAFL